jgi:aryl-alcohol dehydrogenase-like predicted oxidoreductase
MEDLDGGIAVGVSFSDSQPNHVDGGQNVVAMDVHGANTGCASGAGWWPVLDLPGTGTAARHSVMVAEGGGTQVGGHSHGCTVCRVEYRRLGRSGLNVSSIALGSWLTYGNQVDSAMSTACVRRALDLGVILFDTADIYHVGAGETELGKALDGVTRSDYVLATKCYWPMSNNANNRGLSRKHIFESVEGSLRRLRTDYIDLYQCHRYDDQAPLEETLRAFDDLITQGKILYGGISEWRPEQIQDAVDFAGEHDIDQIISSQPQYSMLYRRIEKRVIPICEAAGIGQIVWSPLAQGVLTGKYQPGQTPPPDTRASDERVNNSIGGFLGEETLAAVQNLRPIAEGAGLTMAQLALAWVLRQPNVSACLVGATRPEQVEDNVKAAGVHLDQSTLDAIDEALTGVVNF